MSKKNKTYQQLWCEAHPNYHKKKQQERRRLFPELYRMLKSIEDGYKIKSCHGRTAFFEGVEEPKQFLAQGEGQAIDLAAKKRRIGRGHFYIEPPEEAILKPKKTPKV